MQLSTHYHLSTPISPLSEDGVGEEGKLK